VTTTSNSTAPISRTLRRVGLWGAPGSGKTTFLAALNIAITRSAQDLLIFGIDDESTEFLSENTSMLTKDRLFPPATEANRPLSWAMHVPAERSVKKRFGRTISEPYHIQLNIDLLDAPGRSYASVRTAGGSQSSAALGFDDDDDDASASPEEELVEHLAACDGIVFLFDPTREKTKGDAYDYFQGTLARIAQRRLTQNRERTVKLPQYLAVCMTKLDDPDVYRHVKRGGYRTFDEDDPFMFPRVHEDSAYHFFAELCRDSDVGNADLVQGAIGHFFMPDRVKYFVTSAIGFYLGNASRFREQDYKNTVEESAGSPRIRGAIYPINVVEPLLWIAQCLATTAG
jgi:energy-coupling factor transporter ATP-binding protein EcfA2